MLGHQVRDTELHAEHPAENQSLYFTGIHFKKCCFSISAFSLVVSVSSFQCTLPFMEFYRRR